MSRQYPTLSERRAEAWAIIGEVYPEYHPLLHLADVANDPRVDDSLQVKASSELAQYLLPKLKASEVTVEGRVDGASGQTVVIVGMPDPVLDA